MKVILLLFILICCLIIYTSCKEYFEFRENYTEINFLPRKIVGNASCIKDDIELTNSIFKCKMNEKYSPIPTNITTVKYQNFTPYPISKSQTIKIAPTISFLLINTLTPSLDPLPLFSDDDFNLIGTTTDPITKNISLNDYKKIMKVISSNNIETSSLEDNNFLYLPDCIVPYINHLNDMELLQPFIDINKIKTITDIATQFQSYLKGLLINYIKPSNNNFRLQREIIIIFTDDKKNIVNIQFNDTISYLDDNQIWQTNYTSNNINTKYDLFVINSAKDNDAMSSVLSMVKMYGNALKSRQMIDDFDIDVLVEKIKNIKTYNTLYVNYYLIKNNSSVSPRFGIQLVKRVDSKLIFVNYYDVKDDFNYYKNMCPDPANNFFYKGRCYANCPKNYSNLGLTCVLNNEIDSHEINKLFAPDSNFCKQICERSNDDISRYDSVMQQACWCDTMSCQKCGEFSIGSCNC
jgi:hypothetical protein